MSLALEPKAALEIALAFVGALSSGVSREAALRRAIDKVMPIVPPAEEPCDMSGEPLAGSAMAAALALTNVGFISREHVKKITGWSDTTLWRNWSEGRFPKPIQVSKGRVGWLPGDIAEWLKGLRRTNGQLAITGHEATAPAFALPTLDPGRRRRGRPRNPQRLGGAGPP
jgi:prophage regulatory protein